MKPLNKTSLPVPTNPRTEMFNDLSVIAAGEVVKTSVRADLKIDRHIDPGGKCARGSTSWIEVTNPTAA
jgi:hypothetical protein